MTAAWAFDAGRVFENHSSSMASMARSCSKEWLVKERGSRRKAYFDPIIFVNRSTNKFPTNVNSKFILIDNVEENFEELDYATTNTKARVLNGK